MEGKRVNRQGPAFGIGRFWRFAVFAAAGTLGVPPQTKAAIYYWQDSTPAATETVPAPKSSVRRAKTQRRGDKKSGIVEKDTKPQGPLIISVSIAEQRLRIYDSNGLFAQSPISTGMPGHSTPMGVFSVIQKQKFHQSNIYSGAPMPFMQRITWSGIALHAGVLPGHPASHGCIRMPMAFAIKMYGWTRMGARVIVTPGEVTPASFSHPLLASVKVPPQPVAAQASKADAAPVQTLERPETKAADIGVPADAARELRPTVGHADEVKAASDTPSKIKTADASGALPATLSARAVSDAAPAAERASPPANDGPAETAAAKAADGEAKPADAATTEPARLESATEADKPSDIKPADKAAAPADPVKAVTTPPVAPAATNEMPLKEELKSDPAKAYLGPPLKKNEQIAVFVSRRDSKLYVRQNFAPLFNVPVTITADERPLGTHIFTAQVDKSDANVLHWSVVSLPAPGKGANRHAEEVRVLHGRKIASTASAEAKSMPAPDSPAEALDRLSLPAEVMAKIYEVVSTGGSIIVSDQGISGGETGEGTDFIVSLR